MIDINEGEEITFPDHEIITVYDFHLRLRKYYAKSAKNNVLFLVKKGEKYGLLRRDGKEILPVDYDKIEPYQYQNNILSIEKKRLKGIKILNTPYPEIPAKYETIQSIRRISVNAGWSFMVFQVTWEGNTGFVGENGVEYFQW